MSAVIANLGPSAIRTITNSPKLWIFLNFYLIYRILLISIRALEIGAFQEADVDENL